MRAFDAHAISRCRVPGLLLMENAGAAACSLLVAEVLAGAPRGKRAVVVCGVGNNGGDGLVLARHLSVRGADPIAFVAGDAQRISADAAANLAAWRGVGGEVRDLAPGQPIAALASALEDADVVVDALFGTGLDRPIEGWLAEVVTAVNRASAPRFALDVPSGMDADTGSTLGVAVMAQATVTFGFHKLGLLTPNGARLAGPVHVVDLGVPSGLVSHVGSSAQLLDRADVARAVAPREPGMHKTAAGHVLVVGGSAGKVGAPQLVARGAMRAGAGLATIATWPEAADAIEGHVLEAMTARIDRRAVGSSLDALIERKDSIVVGPGLGLDDDARLAVEYLLAAWRGPLVVDADALSMFAGRSTIFSAAKNAILTPHPGELGRLVDKSAAQIEADRYRAARELAAATGAVVVLKGAHTIVGAPDGRLAVSPVACPALATAGSGDLLAGIVAALAGSLPAFDAACAGVMLHALAGQAWSSAHGDADRGLLASEIGDMLPSLRSPASKPRQ